MFVRLRAPGRVAPLSVEFAAAAATTEITVATVNNDLVDYPPTRDYTIEVLGDGDINGGDDAFYTPGDPGEATVTVTDDDQLQIVTVHPQQAFVKEGGDATFVFRRTGDTSKQLWITYWRESLHGEEHSDTYEDDVLVNKRFPPGQSEVTATVLQGSDFPDDQVANRWFPYTLTAQLYGDGQLYGVHRVWKAGTPSTAAIIYYDDDATKKMNLRGAYPSSGQVGETIDIDFTVLNAGSEATGNTITISSVKRAELDTNQTKPPEPRVGCTIAGPIAAGETGTCRATFTLTAQDLAGSRLALDSTASDGTTTSGPFRIYLKVLVLVPDIFDKDKKQVSLMYDPMRRIYEDMPALKYKVELNETARTHLKQIASRGEASARKVKRALVLLKADEGLPDRDIASGLLISASTVGRVRTRFVKEGLDSALNERPRPGQKRKLDGRQEAHLIAVACSDA